MGYSAGKPQGDEFPRASPCSGLPVASSIPRLEEAPFFGPPIKLKAGEAMTREEAESRGEVVLYEAPDGQVRVDVRLEHETVWLSIDQMAKLFGRDKSVIAKHLRNLFAYGELTRKAVVAKNATTAADGKTYQVEYFNLDAILSVGYRVSSKRGTQFRIWATRTLREHLFRGYSLNERRLRERGLGEIQEAVGLLARTLTQHALVTDEGRAVLEIVQGYTRAWRWLFEYDEGRLPEAPARPVAPAETLSISEARAAISSLRKAVSGRGEAGPLFGQERGGALEAILGAIEQTYGGQPLYRTAQERAAHLLYFAVKDHPFSDGNKRIGTLFFLEFLRRNKLLTRPDGRPRLEDNAMVALTLLIAESAPAQKDLMIRLVLNLLGDEAP
jgi:prophage maintenance system killer protein